MPRTRPVLKLDEDSVTVAQMIQYVQQRLMLEDRPLRLRQLLRNVHTRQGLVCVFLAILELIRFRRCWRGRTRCLATSC